MPEEMTSGPIPSAGMAAIDKVRMNVLRWDSGYSEDREGQVGYASTSLRFAPGRKILQRLLVGCGVKAEDRAAVVHFRCHKILECCHLERFVCDFIGEVRGDHDDAVAIAEDDVPGKHRCIAAADRAIDLDRLMQGEVGRRARPLAIGGKGE